MCGKNQCKRTRRKVLKVAKIKDASYGCKDEGSDDGVSGQSVISQSSDDWLMTDCLLTDHWIHHHYLHLYNHKKHLLFSRLLRLFVLLSCHVIWSWLYLWNIQESLIIVKGVVDEILGMTLIFSERARPCDNNNDKIFLLSLSWWSNHHQHCWIIKVSFYYLRKTTLYQKLKHNNISKQFTAL